MLMLEVFTMNLWPKPNKTAEQQYFLTETKKFNPSFKELLQQGLESRTEPWDTDFDWLVLF